MKKLMMKSALTAAAISCALGAQAQSQKSESPVYAEIAWTSISYKESGYTFNPRMLRAIVGTELNTNLGVEGMFGAGIADSTVNVLGVNVTGKIDNAWGLFLKPKTNLAPNLEAFARLGYVKTNATASVPGYAISSTGGDMSYGAGLSFKITETTSLNADYTSYYNKNGVTGTGFSMGLGFRF